MTKIKKPFSQWNIEDIVDTFDIDIDYTSTNMDFWLNTEGGVIAEDIENRLEKLRMRLLENVSFWNETELEGNFVFPLINEVDFYDKEAQIKHFMERPLAADIGDYHIFGTVDSMISRGIGKPKTPIFCLKEFKKSKNASNDPEGQLAAAMIVAQKLNNNDKPIFGAYVVGREWIFTLLKGIKMVQSPAYVATDKEGLRKIYLILNNLKSIIKAQ